MKNPDNMGMPSGQEKEETTKEDLLRTLANFEKIADELAKDLIKKKQRIDTFIYAKESEKESEKELKNFK